MNITPELFAIVCYNVLMQNGEGIIAKSPSYLLEKMDMVSFGWDAFGFLDDPNQRIVAEWCIAWKIVPDHPSVRAFIEGHAAVRKTRSRLSWTRAAPVYNKYGN